MDKIKTNKPTMEETLKLFLTKRETLNKTENDHSNHITLPTNVIFSYQLCTDEWNSYNDYDGVADHQQ